MGAAGRRRGGAERRETGGEGGKTGGGFWWVGDKRNNIGTFFGREGSRRGGDGFFLEKETFFVTGFGVGFFVGLVETVVLGSGVSGAWGVFVGGAVGREGRGCSGRGWLRRTERENMK